MGTPKSLLVVSSLLVLVFSAAQAQDEFSHEEMSPEQILILFGYPEFLVDLELSDDQKSQIEEADDQLRNQISDIMKTDRSREKINQVYKSTFDYVFEEVLLKHQVARFAQLINRRKLLEQHQGSLGSFLIRDSQPGVDLSETQVAALSKAHRKCKNELAIAVEEFEKQIEEILSRERSECLEILSQEQEVWVTKMLGDRNWGQRPSAVAERILKEYSKRPDGK